MMDNEAALAVIARYESGYDTLSSKEGSWEFKDSSEVRRLLKFEKHILHFHLGNKDIINIELMLLNKFKVPALLRKVFLKLNRKVWREVPGIPLYEPFCNCMEHLGNGKYKDAEDAFSLFVNNYVTTGNGSLHREGSDIGSRFNNLTVRDENEFLEYLDVLLEVLREMKKIGKNER